MTKEIKNKITDFLGELNTEIDVNYFIDLDDLDLTDSSTIYDNIYSKIEDSSGFDVEIIYYSNAIDYLMKNDPSLNESLEIASEYGFTTDNLNSEVLASLLASKAVRDEFYSLESEITSFFKEIEEEIQIS